MLTLGLYCGHDSNYCLVRDGVVLAHVESERTTRNKHQAGLVHSSLRRLLDYCNVTIPDIDAITIGGTDMSDSPDPYPELDSLINTVLDGVRSSDYLYRVINNQPSNNPLFRTAIRWDGHLLPVFVLDHHLSHAALTYYTSPYPSAAICSWDGGGDGAYILLARGENGKITHTSYNPPCGEASLSIGGTWTELGKLYTDLNVGSGVDYEGKIMAHAAYGIPNTNLCNAIRMYMEHYHELTPPLKDQLQNKFRELVDFYTFHSASCKDFSASLQHVTEQIMEEVLVSFIRPGEPLCLTGGCAYNCVANGKIAQRYPKLFITNIPHDGGLSLGAALYYWYHELNHVFTGISEWSPYTGIGTGEADITIAEQVVDDITNGKVVAWYNGRSESGKRALGNRSILMDPRMIYGRSHLNNLKGREWFRPFSPSVLYGINGWYSGNLYHSPYMSGSCKVSPKWQDIIPATIHVDGSCRPQIVTNTLNPVFHRILTLMDEVADVPLVLNTSFNIREPIVDTIDDAHHTFNNSLMDVLYVNGDRYTH